MKRVLIVSYRMPPDPAAGALRPGYLRRYLPDFGWQTSVVTRPAKAGSSRVPYRVANALFFPDATMPWVPGALRRGAALLREQQFDAIVSSAMPPSAHVIGYVLAKQFDLPWVADFRDLWAGNPYTNRTRMRSALEERLERRLLGRAAAITTISDAIAARLSALHHREVSTIPNGYDPADWQTPATHEFAQFDLTYTGTMYDGKRSPDILFAALQRLRALSDPAGFAARVHFFGPDSDNVRVNAAQHAIQGAVIQHGIVPRTDALRAQARSAALLLFLNMDRDTSHELGSKILEYAGARRPIIACGPSNSAMKTLIERNGLGWFCSTIDDVSNAITQAYSRYLRGETLTQVSDEVFPTAREVAHCFADLLDGITGNAKAPASTRAVESIFV